MAAVAEAHLVLPEEQADPTGGSGTGLHLERMGCSGYKKAGSGTYLEAGLDNTDSHIDSRIDYCTDYYSSCLALLRLQ